MDEKCLWLISLIEHPESKENVKTEHFLKSEPFPELLVNIKAESELNENDLDYLFNDNEEDLEDLPLVKKQKKKKKIVKKEKEIVEEEDDDKEYQCYR